jgi:hypothetical protein
MLIGSDHNLETIKDIPLLFLENKAFNMVKTTKSFRVHIDERLTLESWTDLSGGGEDEGV